MQEAKYLSEENLFNLLGDFSMTLLETMGDEEIAPEQRARSLAHAVEELTATIWEGTPRLGEVYPSTN